MPHVVTDACIRCRYTSCVDVCPTEAFRKGPNMLVINPDECNDDGSCVMECPATAIYPADELPDDKADWVKLNRELADEWPAITSAEEPPADADDWNGVRGKRKYLKRR